MNALPLRSILLIFKSISCKLSSMFVFFLKVLFLMTRIWIFPWMPFPNTSDTLLCANDWQSTGYKMIHNTHAFMRPKHIDQNSSCESHLISLMNPSRTLVVDSSDTLESFWANKTNEPLLNNHRRAFKQLHCHPVTTAQNFALILLRTSAQKLHIEVWDIIERLNFEVMIH